MNKQKPLVLAVKAAIGAITALSISSTHAQQDSDQPLFEELVVTGSRIQRANLVSSSPVTQLDNEQLRLTGLTRVEDALAAIPAISLDQSSGQAIEATGIATLQLRNLGTKRTLVLMNGRRLPAGTPSGGVDSSAADINLIPGQLIERVEAFAELMFMDTRSTWLSAAGGGGASGGTKEYGLTGVKRVGATLCSGGDLWCDITVLGPRRCVREFGGQVYLSIEYCYEGSAIGIGHCRESPGGSSDF